MRSTRRAGLRQSPHDDRRCDVGPSRGRGVDRGRHDAAAFDPSLKLAPSSNGADRTLTIVDEDDADHYTVAQNMPTQEGAKTMALDEQQHRIY
ncbi:hypothetical protein OKW50_002425 [Paraburkholderia youngii]